VRCRCKKCELVYDECGNEVIPEPVDTEKIIAKIAKDIADLIDDEIVNDILNGVYGDFT